MPLFSIDTAAPIVAVVPPPLGQMVANSIKYSVFKGQSTEDADARIQQFNKAYGINN